MIQSLKTLGALAIFATCSLFGAGQKTDSNTTTNQSTSTCDTCCFNPCSCEPCDFKAPCPPSDCAYNAPVIRDIRCGWDVDLIASYVYFQAFEEGLEFASFETLDDVTSFKSNVGYVGLSFDYQSGFKVGLGYNFGCDNWSFNADYFRYHGNVGQGSFSAEYEPDIKKTGELPWAPQINSTGYGNYAILTSEGSVDVNAKWRLEIDSIDFTLSRKYFVGKSLTFNTFFGLRTFWIDQKYNFSGNGYHLNTGLLVYSTDATTKSWGIGPVARLTTDWHLCWNLFLFGDVSFCSAYTDYDSINIDWSLLLLDDETTYTFSRSDSFKFIRSQGSISIGLGWADYLWCNDWYLDLRASYEIQNYWNHNVIIPTALGSIGNNTNFYVDKELRPSTDLFLHGLVVSARLDF